MPDAPATSRHRIQGIHAGCRQPTTSDVNAFTWSSCKLKILPERRGRQTDFLFRRRVNGDREGPIEQARGQRQMDRVRHADQNVYGICVDRDTSCRSPLEERTKLSAA